MAIVDVVPKWSEGPSSGRGDESGKELERDSERYFTIRTDSPNDTAETVRRLAQSAGTLPRYNDQHPENNYLRCREVAVRPAGLLFYEATCVYRGQGEADADGTGGESPTAQPTDIRWTTITTEEQIDQDANGWPICTIVGEPFDPPETKRVSDLYCTATKNVTGFSPIDISNYIDHTNSDEFMLFPIGTCLIEQFEAASIDAGEEFWRRTVGIHIRRAAPGSTDEKAWWKRRRAEGYYVNVTVGGETVKVRAKDGTGADSVTPVLHDIVTGEEITDRDPGTGFLIAQWYEWRVYDSASFAAAQIL